MFRKALIVVMGAAIIGTASFAGALAGEEGVADGKTVVLCPVTGSEVDAKEAVSYEYKGKVYYFCCASCIGEFKKDPEKYIRGMQGKDAKGAQAPAEHEGHDHGKE